MSKNTVLPLGFAVGTGKRVHVPLAHTIVTGQTQQSGKTTTLRALVARSGRAAVAFATKRGEVMPGRAIRPYLPREGDQPIHWRLVESVIASALDESAGRSQRLLIINASKGARSLADVRRNVDTLMAKSKGRTAGDYELVGAYLDLVLPEMRALRANDHLDLRPDMNVMDLTAAGPQMQALAIRAVLERVNQYETHTLVVIPEAWEFVPNGRNAPAKDEAIAMARKGAAPGVQNYLYVDSQDIAGVDTAVRGAASLWLVGVQREANELKRTLDVVAASVARAPAAAEVATLGIGQFFACFGATAVKTYVQPEGMSDDEACQRAISGNTAPYTPPIVVPAAVAAPAPTDTPAPAPTPPAHANEDDMPDQELHRKFDTLIDLMRASAERPQSPPAIETGPLTNKMIARGEESLLYDEEQVYQRFKARLAADGVLGGNTVTVTPPAKLRLDFQTAESGRIAAGVKALRPLPKQILKLLEGLDEIVGQKVIAERIGRAYRGQGVAEIGKAVKELVDAGFVESKDRQGVRTVLRDKIAADLSAYKPREEDVEAVYQQALYEIATGKSE